MSAIRLVGLTKHFGRGTTAVREVHLDIQRGELFVLLGPSGCGKTTLLRLIAGLERPSSGVIYLDGKDVSHVPPHRRGVGMLFQQPAVYPHLTVRQNLVFPRSGRYNSHDRPGQFPPRSDFADVVNWLDLERLLDRRPFELSGGERQRVALGRLLLRQPAVFLLDEPLAHVDPLLKAQVRSRLRETLQRIGRTTIWVTHDHAEALSVADRLAVMEAGQILQVGTPRDVYERPDSVRVAVLVGDPPINLIPGSLCGPRGPEPGTLFGIRPYDVVVAQDGFLRWKVLGLEYREPEPLVRLGHGEFSLMARVGAAGTVEPGREAAIAWDWRKALRFDAASGRRREAFP